MSIRSPAVLAPQPGDVADGVVADSSVELVHVRSSGVSVREATYFLMAFIWSANGSPARSGHAPAMTCQVRRPKRSASAVSHRLPDRAAHHFRIEVRHGPAAVCEPTVGVLLLSSGRLHDTVQADELVHDHSHRSLLLVGETQFRPCQVQMQASLPSGSARIQNAGARAVRHEPTAGRQGRGDALLGDIVGDGHVDVDAVALRARGVHLLEPERGSTAEGVDAVLLVVRLVAEHGLPERLHRGDVEGVDGDLELCHRRRLRGEPEVGADGRDGAGESNIAFGEATGVVAGEQDMDAGIGDGQIRMVVHLVRRRADAPGELQTLGHGAGAERRLQRAQQHPPVVETLALADLGARELVLLLFHAAYLAKRSRPATGVHV